MEFNLNVHVHRLLQDEPFFAALSRRVDKRPDRGFPTAGVRVNPDSHQFEMVYNPNFFEKLTDAERKDVLKHEFYHLIFDHVTSRRPDGSDPKMWNYATDLAINSHLSNLPKGCLKPGEGPFEDWTPGLSAEAYFTLLKKESEKDPDEGEDEGGEDEGDCVGEGAMGRPCDNGNPGDGEGEGNEPGEGDGSGGDSGVGEPQFDSHEGWGEGDATQREIAKERLKDVLKKAANEAGQRGWGSVPSNCRQAILDRVTSKIDWKKVMRYFIKTSQRANRRSSVKHINRRYPYIHAGRKTDRHAKIAISIDQSGSVDDGMLAAFFSELNKLASIAEFTVIPFDCTVAEDKVYVWKKGETRKWERVRYGGTCFNAPTKYVNERKFDGHIVLTDMCAPKPVASKCQRMWMTTDYYAKHPYFATTERVIGIDA